VKNLTSSNQFGFWRFIVLPPLPPLFREREGPLPGVSGRVQLLSAGSRRCISRFASRKCAGNVSCAGELMNCTMPFNLYRLMLLLFISTQLNSFFIVIAAANRKLPFKGTFDLPHIGKVHIQNFIDSRLLARDTYVVQYRVVSFTKMLLDVILSFSNHVKAN
jgi:hypothetical protein